MSRVDWNGRLSENHLGAVGSSGPSSTSVTRSVSISNAVCARDVVIRPRTRALFRELLPIGDRVGDGDSGVSRCAGGRAVGAQGEKVFTVGQDS